jgi:hypothetical protein
MKILPVGAELTGRQMDMTSLIVAFGHLANSPKNVADNIKCMWSTENFIEPR